MKVVRFFLCTSREAKFTENYVADVIVHGPTNYVNSENDLFLRLDRKHTCPYIY